MHARTIRIAGSLLAGLMWMETGYALDDRTEHWMSVDTIAQTHLTPEALATFLRRAFTSTTDDALFGVPDYWQAPEEFLARRAGDCEDFALLAQAVLTRQGHDAFVLSLYRPGGSGHTVCVVRQPGKFLVFDEGRLRAYRAATVEALLDTIGAWTYAAIARRTGTRGAPLRLITNPAVRL